VSASLDGLAQGGREVVLVEHRLDHALFIGRRGAIGLPGMNASERRTT
jgi:hypothetical protein